MTYEEIIQFGSATLQETYRGLQDSKPQRMGGAYWRAKYKRMGQEYTPIWETFNGRLERRDILPKKKDHHFIYLPKGEEKNEVEEMEERVC